MRPAPGLIAAVALTLVAGGCAVGSGTKAGDSDAPDVRVLRVAVEDDRGYPSSYHLEEFAAQVHELSAGTLRIEPVFRAAGRDIPDVEQAVAQLSIDGELEMSLVPTRAWDVLGVTSLRAVSTPFLITDDQLLRDVLASELADRMMSGLDVAGVIGLAMIHGGLRHPFGFDGPLLGPDDYRGKTIRAPTSATTTAMYEALGARTVDVSGEALDAAIAEGSVAAVDLSFALAPALDFAPYATGNVIFSPQVDVLVINRDVAAGLDEGQLDVLRDAAIATRDRAVRDFIVNTDGESMLEYCDRGGTVVSASPSDIAALEAAVAPVVAQLMNDQLTRAVIQQVTALKSDLVTGPSTCEPPGGRIAAPDGPDGEAIAPPVPDGVYRFEVTKEAAVSWGFDELESAPQVGIHTVTLDAGTWTETWQNDDGPQGCRSSISWQGSMATVRERGNCTDAYRMVGTFDGTVVTWTDIEGLEPTNSHVDQSYFEHLWGIPWTRIGDLPRED